MTINNRTPIESNKKENIKNLIAVIFSKDRPLQLSATLESFIRNCIGYKNCTIKIVWKSSNNLFNHLYLKLIDEYRSHRNIIFLKENNFKHDVVKIINNYKYVLWLVDDNLFIRRFQINELILALDDNSDAIGISLRLGRNTTYCYPMNKKQSLPMFIKLKNGLLKYNWKVSEYDFGYPLELSSSIYRTSDMIPLISNLEFHNPNTLESQMDSKKNEYFANHSYLICPTISYTFCNPINLVQNEYLTNRNAASLKYSPDRLAKLFSNGQRIDITKYQNMIPNACHQEVDLCLKTNFANHKTKEVRKKAKFSIIMANYNKGNFIDDAIKSVLNQSFMQWELIIVDDGSTDDSIQKISSYLDDKRIKLIEHCKNSGIIASQITGVNAISSNLFGTLDSDDALAPNAIEIMYNAHLKHKDAGLIYSQFICCDENLKPVKFGYCAHIEDGKTNLDSDVVSHFKTFKKEFYDKTIGYESDILHAEDKDISYKMEEVGRLVFVDEILYYYRLLSNSDSHVSRNRLIGFKSMLISKCRAIQRRHKRSVDKTSEAVHYFMNAKNKLLKNDFANAESNIQEYKTHINYESFVKHDNRNSEDPKISIIIVSSNKNSVLLKCINSVLQQCNHSAEVIVVDNGRNNEVLQKLLQYKILYVRTPVDLYISEGRNVGAYFSRGKIIAFLDDDCIVDKNYVSNIIETFYHYDIVALRGKIIPNNSSKSSLSEYFDLGSIPTPSTIDTDGNSAFLKKCFIDIGGMNPLFEEMSGLDLSYRLSKIYGESKIIYSPSVIVNHGSHVNHKNFSTQFNQHSVIQTYLRYKQSPIYGHHFSHRSCIKSDILLNEAKRRIKNNLLSATKVEKFFGNQKNIKIPNKLKFSVVIPTFNRPDMLMAAIQSVAEQTYRNFELVIVNDAGKDVQNIVDTLSDDISIRYILHDQNKGLAASRNTGILSAKGQYIALLDDDDIFFPDHLETAAKHLNQQTPVIYTDAVRALQAKIDGSYQTVSTSIPYSIDFDRNKLLIGNISPVNCFVFSRSLALKAGLFDTNLSTLEDWEFWIRLSRCCEFKHIATPTVQVNWRTDGTTMTSSLKNEFRKNRQVIYNRYQKEIDRIPNVSEILDVFNRIWSNDSKPPTPNVSRLVSIVILTINQLRFTKQCVRSIQQHTPEKHEIIFVDNGSTDGTKKWLKALCERHPLYKLINNSTNKGFAVGCNQGIEAASGEYILLLNNDVIVTAHWLGRMLACLEADGKSGIVGPMTNSISGPQRVPRVAYESIDDLPAFAERFFREHQHRRIPHQRIVGFCMLFRRTLVERIGLLDPNFGTGNFEDDDFCLRAALHGHRNYIAADVFIHHFGSQSFIGNGIDYNGVLNNNRNLFLDKWNAVRGDDPLYKELFMVNRTQKVEQLIHMGLRNEAEKHLLDGIRRFPDRPEFVCHLAGLLAEDNRHADALKLLDALPAGHLHLEALMTKGLCHEALGQLPEADTVADQLLCLGQAESSGWNLKGVMAYKQGHVAEAESCFQKAIDSDPAYAEPYANLGIICWENDAQDKALPFFARSFILTPTSATNAANYHAAAMACGAIDQARSDFFEAGALFPLNKQIAFLHIDMLIRQGDHQAAIDAIEDAILLFGIDVEMLKAALAVRRHIGPVGIDRARSSGPTVSLCMIVKNEQAYLAACLQSLKPVVDEIIVVDTGSTDATRDIAEIFGARVFAFQWDDDFSAARNYSLEKATGDWILVMDADEVIAPRDHQRLADLVRKTPRNKPAAYVMTTRNYTVQQDSADYAANTGDYREEKGPGWVPSRKVRLFRNHQGVRFVFPVHEQVDPVLAEMGVPLVECPVPVHHYGKLDAERTSQRWNMYYEIGKAKLSSVGDHPLALKELAVQAALLSKWKESAGYWEKFLALQPDSVEACLNLTRVLAKSGDFGQACHYARQALQRDARRIETHYNLTLSHLQTGVIAEAAQTAAHMANVFPEDPDANLLCALTEMIAGDTSQGSQRLHKLAETVAPNSLLKGVRSLVAALRSAGRDAWIDSLVDGLAGVDALRDIAGHITATDRHKTGASGPAAGNPAETLSKLFSRAVRSYEREDYPTAFEGLSLVIATAPDYWDAYDLLFIVMAQAGQETAIPEQLHPLELRSDLPADMLALIGSGYEAAGDLARAAVYVDRALEVDPDCARAWSLKGVLAFRNHDKPAAAGHFKQSVARDAAWGEPWTNLGIVLWEQNDRDNAIACLENGLNLSPTAPNVATTYHAAISETGQYDKARKRFEKVIERHPDFRRARFLLIDILIRLEAYEAALAQIEAVLVHFGTDPQLLQAARTVRDKAGPMTTAKGKHPSLSLCMIVKNEAQHLPRCLESLKPLVDEMIVVDTGSTDATRDIAEVFGAQVFDIEWQDDFAAARNHSLERASGDWILVMDADEIIAPSDHQAIRNLIRKHQRDKAAFLITTRNYTHKYNGIGWEANDGRYNGIEAGCGWIPSTKTRLFKNAPPIRFEYPVHELVDPALERNGYKIKPCRVPVHHYGFLDQAKVNQKGKLYHVIGKKKLQQMNDDPKAIQELATQANLYEEPQEAILLWNRLAELQPDNVKTFINLSAAHGKSGDYDQAKSAALKAVAIDPSAREGQLNLGRSEFFLGNFPAARNVFAELVRLDPSYYAGLFMLAAANICCGNSPQGLSALKHLQTAGIWSSLPQAFQELARSLSKVGLEKQADDLIHFARLLHATPIVSDPENEAESYPSANSSRRLSLAS